MTGINHRRPHYTAAVRLQWTGSTMIVLGVAVFVIGLLVFPAHLVFVAQVLGGAAAGLGVALVRVGMWRQKNAALPHRLDTW
jgi:hypothetical protein